MAKQLPTYSEQYWSAEPHFGEVLWYSTNKQQQEIKMPVGKKGKKKRYSAKRKGKKMGY